MQTAGVVAGMGLVGGGIAAVVLAGWRARSRAGVLAYLADAGTAPEDPGDGAVDRLPSLADRVLRPLGRRVTGRVKSLYPGRRLDRLHVQLLHAGLATSIRAEEMATVQVVLAGLAVVAGVALTALGGGSAKARLAASALVVLCAVLGPPAWLARRVRARTNALERDLPDVLDLLTIALESGLGLEQAMEAACSDFDSPMADELARTLQEMSLGLSRHAALDNLRARSDSGDLASFVLVLTQADVLGMPIGRVLRTQADEMRQRRRARAREQAARLPVKILFPLMLFILPPLMIIVLGPAVARIGSAFGL